jgi:ABC-2 type transport system ATP-binding protein
MVIEATGLTKTYASRRGSVEAVRDLDLAVEEGEIVGFLGPNGAGKTTTQKMLCTLLRPTAGNATVAGHDLLRDPVAVRRSIGYVGQSGSMAYEARIGEELVDHARLYGIRRDVARRRGEALLARLDLTDLWDRSIKTLSGGQRRRLDIAMGLVHEPRIVFLDEPTGGLDPQARANLWDHVRSLRDAQGATVFLTTHYLEEADALCDRVFVIDRGTIVAAGTPDELKRRVSGDAIVLTVGDEAAATRAADALVGVAAGAPQVEGPLVRIQVPSAVDGLPAAFRALDATGVVLLGVEVHRPTLDDVFLSLTGRALRDDAGGA